MCKHVYIGCFCCVCCVSCNLDPCLPRDNHACEQGRDRDSSWHEGSTCDPRKLDLDARPDEKERGKTLPPSDGLEWTCLETTPGRTPPRSGVREGMWEDASVPATRSSQNAVCLKPAMGSFRETSAHPAPDKKARSVSRPFWDTKRALPSDDHRPRQGRDSAFSAQAH